MICAGVGVSVLNRATAAARTVSPCVPDATAIFAFNPSARLRPMR
jgi:hypothetical protein